MQSQPNPGLEPLFHAALQHPAGPQRLAYLAGACGKDAALRARLDALLAAHGEADDFLKQPAMELPREGAGSTIGAYKLLQEIGEGGMGVVYMAEQEHPVRRRVALKVIKLGMDTKQVIARFEAERQALAMMDHANIARVFDAGATETGRPYFVMELVRGVPIHEYCDTHNLSTVERLALFVEVCGAVQHAHQKGIIHRDLKPSNVMVTSHDGVPVPKIIDFGVAKATNQKLTERTLFTEYQQIIGTPEFMSPEQAEMSGLDVDTRSDIYSLGVLLYQLLTGTTPVDPKQLRTVAFAEMTRMIREEQPPAPSTRVSKLGLEGEKIARRQSSDVQALSRQLRGELDWIVMKALEKDRTRRYDSASAFAKDVQRHLENQPVEAGPPGAWYRVRKFVHRNRKTVAAVLVLNLAVGLGLAGTLSGYLRADAEAKRSTLISDSLQEVLVMTHAGSEAEREEMQALLATVRETFGTGHATYAAVLDAMASGLHASGEFEQAERLSRESLEIWTQLKGEHHPRVAASQARLGTILRALGRDEEAEQHLRSALKPFEEGSHRSGYAVVDARVELADLLGNRGSFEEADDLLDEALRDLRERQNVAQYRVLEILEQRLILRSGESSMNTVPILRELYDASHEFYREDNLILGIWAMGLGKHLSQREQKEEAEPYLREAIRRFESNPHPPKQYLFASFDALFQVLRNRTSTKDLVESDETLVKLLKISEGILGPQEIALNSAYLAKRLESRGHLSQALDVMLEAHRILVDAGGDVDLREGVRDRLTIISAKLVVQADLSTEFYVLAQKAMETVLQEEPGKPAMVVVLGAALYRKGRYELAAETLDLVGDLADYTGNLADHLSPADHAFRALAQAQLGHAERARTEFQALKDVIASSNGASSPGALLQEVQDLLEHHFPSPEDG